MAKKKEKTVRQTAAMEAAAEQRGFDMVNHATELRRLHAEYTHRLKLQAVRLELQLIAAEQACAHLKALLPALCFISMVAGVALGLLIGTLWI